MNLETGGRIGTVCKYGSVLSLGDTSSTVFSEAVETLKVTLAGLVSSVCGLWFV